MFILGLKEAPRKKPLSFVPQMKANALHRQEAAASCLLDRDRGTGRAVTRADSPVGHPTAPSLQGGALCGSDCSGMTNVLKKKTCDERGWRSDWLQCDTADVMSRQERPHVGWRCVCVGGGVRGGDESSTMKPWRWEGQRHVETDSESLGGGVDGWMCHEERQRSEMKMKLCFSYWAAALSPSPRPRILTTMPLLLHSGKKRNGAGEQGGRQHSDTVSFHDAKRWPESLTFSKPMAQSLSILRVYSGLETGAPA